MFEAARPQDSPGRSGRLAASLLTLGLAACAALGETGDDVPEMVTDRPDATESASIVPQGSVQLEAGYDHIDLEGTATIDDFPNAIVRIGLTRPVELRVGWRGYRWQDPGNDGAADTSLGVKFRFVEPHGARPAMALLVDARFPTGSAGISAIHVDPGVRLLFAHDLTERLSLGYNIGALWTSALSGSEAGESRGTLSAFTWTASLGIGATERLGFYAEFFGESGLSADGGATTFFDGGATYSIRRNLQVDLGVGVGLSDGADDWFSTLGVSHRWPR